MRHYWLTIGLLLAFFLALFTVVEVVRPPLLYDPSPWMSQTGVMAAAVGVGLLLLDVLLPVPSSLVMISHGALFGVVGGTLLSLTGSLGATLVGLALGRRGEPMLQRLLPAEEKARANRLLQRWGNLAILITRPIPLLAETVAIMAGASPISWRSVIIAALMGAAPGALLYALAGATAASFENGILTFILVLLVAGLFWFVSRHLESSVLQPFVVEGEEQA